MPSLLFFRLDDSKIVKVLTEKRGILSKGHVLSVAEIGGILAVKNTPSLIPLCHPLALTSVDVKLELKSDHVKITCQVSSDGKTGVEMEALTGASVAALTVYDMCKSVSHAMQIESVKLVHKSGGKSDIFQ